ncbi:hypothetical protein GCM10025795_19680 [Verticiella sediminum]
MPALAPVNRSWDEPDKHNTATGSDYACTADPEAVQAWTILAGARVCPTPSTRKERCHAPHP